MKARLSLMLKIILPVVIGMAVIYFLFGSEIAAISTIDIDWSRTTAIGVAAAVILLLLRETGLAWRFRALTDHKLKWLTSFKVSLICDFTSAITPTSAGGSILSMIFIHKEGIKLGRATAITLLTLFLDELFFIIAAPLLMVIVGEDAVFAFTDGDTARGLMAGFWIVYSIMAIITLLLVIGLFHSPHRIANALTRLFSWKLLRRWWPQVKEMGDNLVQTSSEIRNKTLDWWIAPVAATVLTWMSRFLIVNALFYAFFPEADQLTVLARQFIVWGLLIFIPTPGGSGVSEMLFKTYYSDMVGGPLLAMLAIIWRVLTYYVFLLAGVLLIPSYLKLSSHKTRPENEFQNPSPTAE